MVSISEINESARNALKTLLDDAESEGFEKPANSTVVAELEFIISETSSD